MASVGNRLENGHHHASASLMASSTTQQRPQRTPLFSSTSAAADLPAPTSLAMPTPLPAAATAATTATTTTAAAPPGRADPYHLAPEDAFHSALSPPRERKKSFSAGGSTDDLRSSRSTLRPRGAVGGSSGIGSSIIGGSNSSSHLGMGMGMGMGLGMGMGNRNSRSRSRRRRKRTWRKLLWVKQSYADNYTDQATFLEHLQRNPRLQPYDFWPLVADSTVIVQHVCSVIIFVVCFIGIFQERLSPVAVVTSGSIATCFGWLLWEWWAVHEQAMGNGEDDGEQMGVEEGGGEREGEEEEDQEDIGGDESSSFPHTSALQRRKQPQQLQTTQQASSSRTSSSTSTSTSTSNDASLRQPPTTKPKVDATAALSTASELSLSANKSATNLASMSRFQRGRQPRPKLALAAAGGAAGTETISAVPTTPGTPATPATPAMPHYPTAPFLRTQKQQQRQELQQQRRIRARIRASQDRMRHRFTTIKSAVLIYFTLLGLSPILKSLTRSTSSDSIWSMSFWLLAINIFFFDYSGVWVGAHKFPVASLSTNAALMASTVLASRLPSTGQVFSLTLFSIEVFGIFPVFRRYARYRSWRYHVVLTVLLVLGAGAGVGMTLAGGGGGRGGAGAGGKAGAEIAGWPWRSAVVGMVTACVLSAVAMGGCSWWLIGLQKYKNEIYGPWDPARPTIISRRHWDDD